MEANSLRRRTRREFVRNCIVVPVSLFLAACMGRREGTATPGAITAAQPTAVPPTAAPPAATTAPAPAATEPQPSTAIEAPAPTPTPAAEQVLAPTPACGDDDDEPTPAQTEGPYFTPNSPERASLLEPGVEGTKLTVTGYVLSTACEPIAGALLDFWQCDAAGVYDNAGYLLRGHQFTDEQGRYRLETIVPGLYPGRTRHIHVKVQAPNGPILTTQQYFPDEPDNARDRIFDPALVMDVRNGDDGKIATFRYVLATA